MKKLAMFSFIVLFAVILTACATPIQISPTTAPTQTLISVEGKLRPGDKIGEMSIEKHSIFQYKFLLTLCEFDWEKTEPSTQTTECEVSPLSEVAIGFGWNAKEPKFASNWEAMSQEIYIDDHQVALDDFGWDENKYSEPGGTGISRGWSVVIKNLSIGKHTIRVSTYADTPLDDGYRVFQPGKYEYILNLTVKKPDLPTISLDAKIGQNTYTSSKAKLDFLLYLPSEYGKDPQQKWPMIVFLHGEHLRGAYPDFLRGEPLPKMLETQMNFPFVVVSPVGNGGYQFWATEEMIKPLFTLLEEIQTMYSIDPNRIYLIGDGMGGNGVWEIGLRNPEYFAALAPIGGYIGYPFETPDNICDLKDVPVWAFHGGKDGMVPVEVEQNLVDALNACGGNAQITVKPDATINIRYEAYANPELYDWFLSQSRK